MDLEYQIPYLILIGCQPDIAKIYLYAKTHVKQNSNC